MRLWPVVLILLPACCDHVEPTVATTGGRDQPFQVGAPLRLTHSDGFDGDASLSTALSPDGSTMVAEQFVDRRAVALP